MKRDVGYTDCWDKKIIPPNVLNYCFSLLGPPFCTQQDSMDLINNIDIFDRREAEDVLS